MLNEFAYCPRLCYIEWIEGEFVESEDTVDGRFKHRRVDHGNTVRKKADRLEIWSRDGKEENVGTVREARLRVVSQVNSMVRLIFPLQQSSILCSAEFLCCTSPTAAGSRE